MGASSSNSVSTDSSSVADAGAACGLGVAVQDVGVLPQRRHGGVVGPALEVLGHPVDQTVSGFGDLVVVRRPVGRSAPLDPSASPVASRHTRSRKWRQPSMTSSVWSVQSKSSAGGPTNRWKIRNESAPTRVEVLLGRDQVAFGLGHFRAVHADHALGEQSLERLLRPLWATAPRRPERGCRSGRTAGARWRARCRRCTGRPASSARRRCRRPGRRSSHGSQKRRKYQDESTNVSMVSVSRSARWPQRGHVVHRNAASLRNGDSPVGRNSTSSGSSTGSSSPAGGRSRRRGNKRRVSGIPSTSGGRPASPAGGTGRCVYRCLFPRATSIALSLASAVSTMPSSHSLFIRGPSPVYASPSQPSGGCTVRIIGKP